MTNKLKRLLLGISIILVSINIAISLTVDTTIRVIIENTFGDRMK